MKCPGLKSVVFVTLILIVAAGDGNQTTDSVLTSATTRPTTPKPAVTTAENTPESRTLGTTPSAEARK